MTFFPSSELLLDPSPPRVANTLPGQLARGVARGAQLSRRIDPRPFRSPPGLGAGSFARALALEAWDLFTSEPDPSAFTALALPPLPPGTAYEISGSASYRSTNPAFPEPISTPIGPITVFAPLGNVEIRRVGTNEAVWVRAEIGTPQEGDRQLSIGFNGVLFRYLRIDSLAVIPLVGEPIEVPGLLPYPESPENSEYPEVVPLDIVIPRQVGRNPQPLNVPVVIPRPYDLGRRPVPVLYPPGLTPDQRRALPQLWIVPDGIQVGRGGPGDRIVSTPGDSIDIDIDLELLTDYRRREPPIVVTCTGDPEPPGDCCDCEEIRQIVIEELDSKFPPSRPNSSVAELFPAAASRTVVLPPFTKSVRLEIVTLPQQVKSQFGGGDAPDVFYNGWYSLGASSSPSERIPLNYNDVSIPVPPNCTHFSYTIVGGGTASLIVNYQQPD